MKNLLTFLAVLVIPIVSTAQLRAKWSADIPSDNFVTKILGEDDLGLFTLSTRKGDYFINKFDSESLNLEQTADIKIDKINDVKMELEEVLFLDNTILTVVTGYDKSSNSVLTYGIKYSKKTGKFDSKPKLISTVEVEKKRRKGVYGIVTSKSDNFFLIYHRNYDKKASQNNLSLTVYDSELVLVKEMKYTNTLDKGEKEIFGGYKVDENGNVCYSRIHENKGDEERTFEVVTRMFDNGYEENRLEIDLDKDGSADAKRRGITEAEFMLQDGIAYLCGYYVEWDGKLFSYTELNGVFFTKIDMASNSIETQSVSEFTPELAESILSERKQKKGKGIPAGPFGKTDIEFLPSGEMVIVSEYYRVSRNQQGNNVTYTYYYGSILVTKVDQEGNVQWSKGIPKLQIYSESRSGFNLGILSVSFNLTKDQTVYYSYLLGIGSDELYVIFNENPKNFEADRTRLKPLSNPKKGVPAIVTITNDGEMTTKPGYKVLSEEVILRPRISRQVGQGEIIVYGSRKKSEQIGRISFE